MSDKEDVTQMVLELCDKLGIGYHVARDDGKVKKVCFIDPNDPQIKVTGVVERSEDDIAVFQNTSTAEMTETLAQELMEFWINVLHLEAWDIRLRWKVRDRDMNLENSVGCATFNHESRQAIIQMLDPVDFHNDLFEYDYEKTLVHELLHVKFADLDHSGDDLRDRLTHQMIDDLAKAFVNVKRGGKAEISVNNH